MVQMVKDHLKRNGLVFGNSKPGFTLLEILVAMAIIGIMATFIIPNLRRASYERKLFFTQLNALVLYGKQHAIMTNKIQQVMFDFKLGTIQLLQDNGQKDGAGKLKYEPVSSITVNTTIVIPDTIEIQNFYIDGTGFDEMSKYVGRKTGQVWFFIVPEGLAQEVIINGIDTNDTLYDGKPRQFGLVLNPFAVRFKEYDTFQK
jgi:prepilin-type N-terminal cleavage/methylation domain-containing protein